MRPSARAPLRAPPLPLDRLVEVLVQVAAQLPEVDAACSEDPFAVGIVRQRVQQVFERQVGVPTRDRLAEGDVQDDFKGW